MICNRLSMYVPYRNVTKRRRLAGGHVLEVTAGHHAFWNAELAERHLYTPHGTFKNMLREDDVPKVMAMIRAPTGAPVGYTLLAQGTSYTGTIYTEYEEDVLGLVGSYIAPAFRNKGYATRTFYNLGLFLKREYRCSAGVVVGQTEILNIAERGFKLAGSEIAFRSFGWFRDLSSVEARLKLAWEYEEGHRNGSRWVREG